MAVKESSAPECETCYGTGEIDCPDCYGNGCTYCELCGAEEGCPACYGYGTIACPDCDSLTLHILAGKVRTRRIPTENERLKAKMVELAEALRALRVLLAACEAADRLMGRIIERHAGETREAAEIVQEQLQAAIAKARGKE